MRVLGNLRRILGPRTPWEEGIDVARTFGVYAHCLTESLGSARPDAKAAERRIRGREHLEAALALERGLVIVTAHTGGWDFAASLLGVDYELDVVVGMEGEASPAAMRVQDDIRRSAGVSVARVGTTPFDGLSLLRHLRRHGAVAVQLDRPPALGRTTTVRLFEEDFPAPAGPFVLGATAGAPVVPIFVARRGYFDYEIEIAPMIRLERKPSRQAIRGAAQVAVNELERFVRAHPTQWFQFGG